MTNSTRRPKAGTMLAAAATVGALVLSGCAAGQSDSGEASEPKEGGTLTVAQGTDIQPASFFSQAQGNLAVQRMIFNTLIELDLETKEPKPSLAEAWELSEDGRTITFQLREDVTFHDGTPLTSADVIASMETVKLPEVPSQMKSVANIITEVEALGDTEVSISLEHSVTNLFDVFTLVPIVDDESIEGLLEGTAFNGTGPFSVDDYKPGQGLSLSKFEDYWAGAPYLDGVEVTVIPDPQSTVTALRSGEVDMAVDLAPSNAVSVSSDSNFVVVNAPAQDAAYYIGSDVNSPVLQDKRARQGLAYAIDRERLIDQVLLGNGAPASLPWSPVSPAYDAELDGYYSYDLDKARELFEDAGVVGEELTISYPSGNSILSAFAQIIVFDLEEAGLKAVADPLPQADFQTKFLGSSFGGAWLSPHGFGQMAPASLIKGAFPYRADSNVSGFVNDEYIELADALWVETDEAAVSANIEKVNEFLIDQQFVTDLIASYHTYTTTAKLKDMDFTILDYPILDTAYLD
ncbi:ABC transporter substrate-binding protein [Microbacterium xanthum]|uniref:ABC transporter substrate-binding protein n=1 Tax=Microbacterium xanthum TaxID=3079794 RepID=UPI002AD3AA25|nr:ABC transporter substrate-binding protein [Microbacterium sp. KSW-48]MDZ8171176.1 ABC transporter substrate-binding protein [Microbacterium sp. KSW-48]